MIADFPVLDFGVLVRWPHLISSIHYSYVRSLMAYASLLPCFPCSPMASIRPMSFTSFSISLTITTIGAGISGLVAAACLVCKGHSIHVLELPMKSSQDRV
jgi:hypothetical protein